MEAFLKILFLILCFFMLISFSYAENDSSIDYATNQESNIDIDSNIDVGFRELSQKYLDDSELCDDSIEDENTFSSQLNQNNISQNRDQNSNLAFHLQNSKIRQGTQLVCYIVDEEFDNEIINVSGESVSILINGVTYSRTFNEYGLAKLNINLPPQNYTAYLVYSGNNEYIGTSDYIEVNVFLEECIVIPITQYVHRGSTGYGYKVKLINSYGVPIANRTITINANGVTYYRTTNSNGVASLNINLPEGNYLITSQYLGGNGYNTSSIGSVTLHVYSSSNLNQPTLTALNSVVKKGSAFQVALKNSNGVGISNQQIIITLNGNMLSANTDSNGIASFTIPSNINTFIYIITIHYLGSSSYKFASSYKLILVPEMTYDNDFSSNDPNGGTEYSLETYVSSVDEYCQYSSDYVTSLRNSLLLACGDNLEKSIAIQEYCSCMNYSYYANHIYGGLETLIRCSSNCADRAAALVTLSKSAGLPVRYVIGYNDYSSEGHAWAQILIDNIWVVSEPTNTEIFGQWHHGSTYSNKIYGPLSSNLFNQLNGGSIC